MWRISQLTTLQKKLHEKHYQNKNNGHGKTTAINQKQ